MAMLVITRGYMLPISWGFNRGGWPRESRGDPGGLEERGVAWFRGSVP